MLKLNKNNLQPVDIVTIVFVTPFVTPKCLSYCIASPFYTTFLQYKGQMFPSYLKCKMYWNVVSVFHDPVFHLQKRYTFSDIQILFVLAIYTHKHKHKRHLINALTTTCCSGCVHMSNHFLYANLLFSFCLTHTYTCTGIHTVISLHLTHIHKLWYNELPKEQCSILCMYIL